MAMVFLLAYPLRINAAFTGETLSSYQIETFRAIYCFNNQYNSTHLDNKKTPQGAPNKRCHVLCFLSQINLKPKCLQCLEKNKNIQTNK